MAFVVYLFVLIVSAASVLFGLDLMTAPSPPTPNVPIGRSVRHIETSAQHDAEKNRTKAQLDRQKLSPIYPASPPGPNLDIAKTATRTGEAASPPTPLQDTPARAEQTQARSDIQQTQNHCNISACASAYVSFRAADCTYQPYDGPRRLCDKSEGAAATVASGADTSRQQRPTPQDNDAFDEQATAHTALRSHSESEDSDAARIVRKMAQGSGEKDITVLSADGRVIVVHSGAAHAETSTACNVAACARSYNSFDASDCTYQPYDGPRRVCRR
jgi:BA14K-like protein